MLDLNKKEIINVFEFDSAVKNIKDAYIASAQGTVQTGKVVHLTFPRTNGDCHIKSGHIDGTSCYVIKIASGFYDNPSKGLPSSNGMMLAFSTSTGETLAILRDEGWLTDIRTAIGGALATSALARLNATEVLIIGAGIQARLQAQCIGKLMRDRALKFNIWGRNLSEAQDLAIELNNVSQNSQTVSDLDAAVRAVDIIVTATPATTPLFGNGLVRNGTHITAIGADCPGKQELPTQLVADASLLICDLAGQSLEHGEFQEANIQNPELQVLELGHILSGKEIGRRSDQEITIADLTGIAAQDIAIAQTIINAAHANQKY